MMRYRMIDLLRGTRTTAKYNRLAENHFTPESLRALQRRKLADFLLTLRQCNPYYSELLGWMDESLIRTEPEQVLPMLPVTDKPFISENLGKLFHPIPGRKYQSKQTGGSTGAPFSYYVDLETISESWAFILWTWHRYAGYTPGEPYITVAGKSLGAFGNRMKIRVYEALQNNYLISGDVISEGMAADLPRIRKARLLFGYPSSIFDLLEKNPGLFDSHRLRAVFTTSEQLLPNVRAYIEKKLGIPVFDSYGANDGGIISCECEAHRGLHYNPLNCYVETHENGDGQVELLLTSINSFSLPLVRYRVGDVATLGDFGCCPCGSPFPMIRDLTGRTRDLVRLRNGKSVHGVKFNKLFYGFPAVRRYRVVQDADFRLTVYLDIQDYAEWDASEEKTTLERKLGTIVPDMEFGFEPLGELPADNSKFKVIESLVH